MAMASKDGRGSAKEAPSMSGDSYADSLAILAHDVNNVLGTLRGGIDFALLEAGKLSKEAKECLKESQRAVNQIATLIEDFTHIARMEQKQSSMSPERSDIRALVSEMVRQSTPMALYEKVTLAEENQGDPLYCAVDAGFFPKIMANLIMNAIKCSPSGGTVKVIVGSGKSDMKISVQGGGLPVPPAYREKIFERGAQKEVRAAKIKHGWGFSLVFCKLAVQAHGGKIWIEDKDGGGSVSFTLPL